MADKLDIQVSELIPCEVDYTLSDNELSEYFDEQYRLIDEGKRQPATMELAMLGYALDFLDFAEKSANKKIDFTEGSLGVFDGILEALYKMFQQNAPSNEVFVDMVKRATGYFGVMILKNIGGNWVQSNLGMGISIKGTNAFIYNKIARRLTEGRKDEVISFYNALKSL